jgi:hypothetical protein
VRHLGTSKILRIQPFGQLPGRCAARDDPAMPCAPTGRGSPRRRSLAASLIAAAAVLGAVVPAALARDSILTGDAASISHIVGPQPGGGDGLSAADGLYEDGPGAVLGKSRQVERLSDGSGAGTSIFARGSKGMADLLRERIDASGAHLVVIDGVSWRLSGSEGRQLADALTALAAERAPYAPDGLARRVHLNLPSRPLPLIYPESFTGAWRAMVLAGGVWLETDRAGRPFATEEWLAWPGELSRELERRGGDASRLHLRLTGAGDHQATWRQARAGDACALLANGPGAARLGGDAHEFAAQFRVTFGPAPAPEIGPSPIACWPGAELDKAQAAALAAVMVEARSGVTMPPGTIDPAVLLKGRPTEVSVRMGPDPLGLAAALRVDPAGFWGTAKAEVVATGPGFTARGAVQADGSARLSVTPPEPGPVRMRLLVPGRSIQRALGTPVDLLGALKPYEDVLEGAWDKMLGAPAAWALSSPLVRPGQAPGSPVLEVEDRPDPPPDPGPEPAPIPGPEPAP